jgi:hypothetical protein
MKHSTAPRLAEAPWLNALTRSAHAAGSDVLKVGLIGCGGRGTGAAINALARGFECALTALADAFPTVFTHCRNVLSRSEFGGRIDRSRTSNASPDSMPTGSHGHRRGRGPALLTPPFPPAIILRPRSRLASTSSAKSRWRWIPRESRSAGHLRRPRKRVEHRFRTLLALRLRRARDHETDSGWGHRRHHGHPGELPHWRTLASRPRSPVERDGVPDAELALFHLAIG